MARAAVRKAYFVALVGATGCFIYSVWYRIFVDRSGLGAGIGLVAAVCYFVAQLILNWEFEVALECHCLRDDRIEECLRKHGIEVLDEPEKQSSEECS